MENVPVLRVDQQWRTPDISIRLIVAGEGPGLAEVAVGLTPIMEAVEAFVASRPAPSPSTSREAWK